MKPTGGSARPSLLAKSAIRSRLRRAMLNRCSTWFSRVRCNGG
jgi:hypothetical protein